MDLGLTGHVAIVQGASKGIGRGIAESLAREGCDLVLSARSADPLNAAARAIAADTGRRVEAFAADTADLGAMTRLVEFAREKFGRLDIIVANSGGPPPGGVRDLTPEQWQGAANLLIVSPMVLLRAALPLLGASPAPRLFFVTSSSSITPVAGLTLSNTYRPGIIGLVKTLTEELAPENVCVHSIAPGRFDTDRLGHVIDMQAKKAGIGHEEMKSRMEASIPAGRLGRPQEIGDLVAYLSSPRASYLRGGNWLVDGGLVRVV